MSSVPVRMLHLLWTEYIPEGRSIGYYCVFTLNIELHSTHMQPSPSTRSATREKWCFGERHQVRLWICTMKLPTYLYLNVHIYLKRYQ